jgi:hypothetical protein
MSHNPNSRDSRRRRRGKCQMDTDRHQHHQTDTLPLRHQDNTKPITRELPLQCLLINLLDHIRVRVVNASQRTRALNASIRDRVLPRNTQILETSIARCPLLRSTPMRLDHDQWQN